MGSLDILINIEKETNTDIKLRCAVSDTGIGIPEDKIVSIFQPFTQADTSDSRSFGGAGLGLATSKRLIEMMRGDSRKNWLGKKDSNLR